MVSSSAWVERAIAGLPPGDPSLAARARDRLPMLLGEVARWTERVDLTAARDPRELVDLYLADAWILAREAAPGGSWVDVGAGGGAPGLVLGLLRPDLRVTLVEPRARRVAFLRSMAGECGASGLTVLRTRSESLPARGFDEAVSRATFPPAVWLREGARLAAATWVLLARGSLPAPDPVRTVEYEWPLTGVPHRAVRYVAAREGSETPGDP